MLSEKELTASLATADSSVGWVGQVATNVANLGINQALACEMFAIQMLSSPETTSSDGAELCAFGNDGGSGSGTIWSYGHARRHGEWAS